MRTFDAVVIGLGAMGAAACRTLAGRGLRVCGIDRFTPPHPFGSSHGQTRICRKAYFEHPDYIPLLHRCYDLWADLETAADEQLFTRCGLILGGPPESPLIQGVQQVSTLHDLAIEDWPAGEATRRHPQFRLPDHWRVLHEADAGYLRVEACIAAPLRLAGADGATLLTDCMVREWRADGAGYVVRAGEETIGCQRLVLAAGAWTGPLLARHDLPLRVQRRQQTWFACDDPRMRVEDCPVFGFHLDDCFFYGFPQVQSGRIKVAEHLTAAPCDPDTVDRDRSPADEARVRGFLDRHLPGVAGEVVEHSVCLYTLTPDEHFIVDRLPGHDGVALAAGFSGHGFKFAPLIGEILADLVIDGQTTEPIEFLRMRF